MNAEIVIVSQSCEDLIERLCQNDRWSVRAVESTDRAVELIAEETIHLVVVRRPYESPDLTALTEAAEATEHSLPILILATDEKEQELVSCLQLGAICFVPETTDNKDLCEIIERLLSLSNVDRIVGHALQSCKTSQFNFQIGNSADEMLSLVKFHQSVLDSASDFKRSDVFKIAVAIEELLQNAVVHGNLEVSSKLRDRSSTEFQDMINQRRRESSYADRRVTLLSEIKRERVSIKITDQGPGFDPASLPDPTDPEYFLRPHGRGIFLVRAYMDEVAYNSSGNEVTISKQVAS